MARRTEIERTPLAEAIRSLREYFEETQEEFARRLNVTIGTLARYETNAQPNVRTLRLMRDLATKIGHRDLALLFKDHLSALPRVHSQPTRMVQNIKRFRTTLGLTQQDLAQKTGVSVSTITRYETGTQPTAEILSRLAEFAREKKLSEFADIFEGRQPASVFYMSTVDRIHANLFPRLFDKSNSDSLSYERAALSYRQKRIAIALSMVSDSILTKVEKMFAPQLLQIDKQIMEEVEKDLNQ